MYFVEHGKPLFLEDSLFHARDLHNRPVVMRCLKEVGERVDSYDQGQVASGHLSVCLPTCLSGTDATRTDQQADIIVIHTQ